MRFGLAATAALLACATMPTSGGGPSTMTVSGRARNDEPLPSVANKVEHTRGMNAVQLERLSARNARRKRRR